MSVETVFYLGAPKASWLWRFRKPTGRRLFVSYSSLKDTVNFHPALQRWGGDSSAFTCVYNYGCFPFEPPAYAGTMERAQREIGMLDFACVMDWMCEDFVMARTGPWASRDTAVRTHQERTVNSYIELLSIAPGVPWAVTLQGYTRDEYMRCLDMYVDRGIDPRAASRVVMGSMCKRKNTVVAANILIEFEAMGLPVHALGFASEGFARIRGLVTSGDSQACGDGARHSWYIHPGCQHGKREYRERLGRTEWGNCASCMTWYGWWGDNVDRVIAGGESLPPPGKRHAPQKRLPRGQLPLFSEAA